MYFSYVPYKYCLEKFVYAGSLSKDHIDPSIFCILTAKSKVAGTPLADLLVFGERWDVAEGTFRPPVSLSLGSGIQGLMCLYSFIIGIRLLNLWVSCMVIMEEGVMDFNLEGRVSRMVSVRMEVKIFLLKLNDSC